MKRNYNSLMRERNYTIFQNSVLRNIDKADSRTFGMSLQNSKKYKSHKIKKKRLCK